MDRQTTKRMPPANDVIMASNSDEPTERQNAFKRFFVSHMKTLVTLFMIVGTVAVIVVIVMVHKVKLAEQHDDHERACLDVAIVGAGLSGTYAAWRLRNSGLKITIFEVSDRIGGRVHTRQLAGLSELNAELGAMYYLPQHHRRLNSTIRALGLSPRALRPPNHDQLTHYLRGVHMRGTELTSDKLPYNLAEDERHLLPEQLIKMYLAKAVSNESDLTSNPLRATTKDGSHLYKHGFWNILGRVGTREGYNYLYDTAEWRSFLSNDNAAVLGSVSMQLGDQPLTIAEGMDEIPKRMVDQFLNASSTHYLETNWRLSCVKKREFKKGYNLIFVKTVSTGDNIKDTYTKEEVCARRVVLAMPPKAITKLNWRPLEDKWQLREDLDTVEPVPAIRVLFLFDRKLPTHGHRNGANVRTDLPIRQVVYLGGSKRHSPQMHKQSRLQDWDRWPYKTKGQSGMGQVDRLPRAWQMGERHLYMVANLDSSDTLYFADMLSKVKRETGLNRSDDIVKHITGQLAQVFGLREEDIPIPVAAVVKDWSKTPAECAWHIWRKGVKVDKVMNRMIKPLRQEDVYVVGSTFCGGDCQLWMEGALKTVDLLLQWHFNIR